MKINFFEEYPTENNLEKLNFVSWPSTVFMATSTLEGFNRLSEEYKELYPHITFGWWPVLSESYWISGFSDPKELESLFLQLTQQRQKSQLPLLLDLELPFQKPTLFKNFQYLKKNREKIARFISSAASYNLRVYTAEYPLPEVLRGTVLRWLGVSPALDLDHKKILMAYSSIGEKYLGTYLWGRIKRLQGKYIQKYSGKVAVGLGTIATGALGNEPILKARELRDDIVWAEENNVEEVFIFRLGGITMEYKAVLESAL